MSYGQLCHGALVDANRRIAELERHMANVQQRAREAVLGSATITPRQVRSARRLLGWWQSDLAKMVRVSEKSIRAFESGELSGNAACHRSTGNAPDPQYG